MLRPLRIRCSAPWSSLWAGVDLAEQHLAELLADALAEFPMATVNTVEAATLTEGQLWR